MTQCVKSIIYQHSIYCVAEPETVYENGNFVLNLGNEKVMFDKVSLFRFLTDKLFIAVQKDEETWALQPLREHKKYQPPTVLGRGSYGITDYYSIEDVVLKSVLRDMKGSFSKGMSRSASEFEIGEDFVKEVCIYRLISNLKCSPKFYGFEKDVIAMERGVMTLRERMGIRQLNYESVIKQLLLCMYKISLQGIINADIKPENIVMINENPMIIDWGLAQVDRTERQTMVKSTVIQTLNYRSPEILLYNLAGIEQGLYDYKVDIWSLGCILFELIIGKQFITSVQDEKAAVELCSMLSFSDGSELPQEEKGKSKFLSCIERAMKSKENYLEFYLTRMIRKRFENTRNLPFVNHMALLVSGMLHPNPNQRFSYSDALTSLNYKGSVEKFDYLSFPSFTVKSERKVWVDFILRMNMHDSIRALIIQLIDWCLNLEMNIKMNREVFEAISNLAEKLRGNFKDGFENRDKVEYEILKTLDGKLLFWTLYDKGVIRNIEEYLNIEGY